MNWLSMGVLLYDFSKKFFGYMEEETSKISSKRYI